MILSIVYIPIVIISSYINDPTKKKKTFNLTNTTDFFFHGLSLPPMIYFTRAKNDPILF